MNHTLIEIHIEIRVRVFGFHHQTLIPVRILLDFHGNHIMVFCLHQSFQRDLHLGTAVFQLHIADHKGSRLHAEIHTELFR